MKKQKVILMALSPSGGHIYPALAIAEKLSRQSPGLFDIHFIYSRSALAQKILKEAPYPRYEISIGGLARGQGSFQKAKTLLQLPFAFFKALFIIYKTRADMILGTGGSASVPVALAGFFMRKKVAVWEANSKLGLANRALAPFVSCVFTVFPKLASLPPKKQIQSAYPLRRQISQFQSSEPFLPKDKLKILVLGGSQGSVFLNQAVSRALEDSSWRKDFFICHQTGDKPYRELSQKYQPLKEVLAFPFAKDIQRYYWECDLIFSRAGSGAIAEAAFFGKALVLIPLTYSAGGHQFQNALSLSSKGAAEMIPEKDFSPEAFKSKVLDLAQNREKRKQLGSRLRQIYQTEDRITGWIVESCKA